MDPKKGKSNMIWVLVLIVAIVIIVALMFRAKNNKTEQVDTNNSNNVAQVDVEGTEDVSIVTTPVAVSVPAASLSYQKALVTYKDYRMQITENCQITPNNVTYKNGTSIMIDNRSSTTKNIKIDGAVSIKGYGFKIIKLSSSTLPKTILVDCGASQNVATILIQK